MEIQLPNHSLPLSLLSISLYTAKHLNHLDDFIYLGFNWENCVTEPLFLSHQLPWVDMIVHDPSFILSFSITVPTVLL